MAIAAFKRVEMKFLLNRIQFEVLRSRLDEYMEPDAYCKDGQYYSIFNVYYDTADSRLIRASLEKPYYKEKLRMRSYASPVGENDKVFLELKKKTGGVVHKRRAIMTLKEAKAFLETGKPPAAGTYMNRQVMQEIAYFLQCNKISPAAYIRYNRMAFFGKEDSSFRITFDFGIATRREEVALEKGSYGKSLLPPNQFLMEIKITGAMPIWLAEVLAELKIYKTSFSKYGMEYKRHCSEDRRLPVMQPFVLFPKEQGFCANH